MTIKKDTIDILRSGVQIEYEPPEAAVVGREEKTPEEVELDKATATIVAQDLTKKYEDLIERVQDIRSQIKQEVRDISYSIDDEILIEVLDQLGYDTTITLSGLKTLRQDSNIAPYYTRIAESFYTYCLGLNGNLGVFAYSDLLDLEDILRETLEEILESEFYPIWVDSGFKVHYYPDTPRWYSGEQTSFDHMIYYYWEKARMEEDVVDKVEDYLSIVPHRLSKCLWENLFRIPLGTENLTNLLRQLLSIRDSLAKIQTLMMLGYVLPNISLAGVVERIKASILESVSEHLRRELMSIAYRASSSLVWPIFDFTDKLEEDIDCDLFSELTEELYNVLEDNLINLQKCITKRLDVDRHRIKLMKTQYTELGKKKNTKSLINIINSIIEALDYFINSGGKLRAAWYDQLYEVAYKNNEEKAKSFSEVTWAGTVDIKDFLEKE